ncbi:hypothetical protein [Phyllobacterium sp. P5_D12]
MSVARLEVGSTSSRKRFVEHDGTVSLFRRSLAEGVGTAMLMITVVGSGLQSVARSFRLRWRSQEV